MVRFISVSLPKPSNSESRRSFFYLEEEKSHLQIHKKHLKVEYDGNIDQLFDKTLTAEGFNAIPNIVSNARLLSLNALADQ